MIPQVSDILDTVGNIANALNNSVLNDVIGNATDIAANVAEQLNATAVTDFLGNITNADIDDLLGSGGLPFLQAVLLNPDLIFSTSKDSYVGPYLPNPHCLVSYADTKPNTRSRIKSTTSMAISNDCFYQKFSILRKFKFILMAIMVKKIELPINHGLLNLT